MQSQQTMLYVQTLLANPILYLQALLANPRLYLQALLTNPKYLQALLANPCLAGAVQAAGSGGRAPCGSGGPGLVGPSVLWQQSVAVASHADRQPE